MIAVERFFSKYVINLETNCWNWTDKLEGGGYGRIRVQNKRYQAHRYSWLTHRGPIPRGLNVLHKCDNPACVNPDHLFIGTHMDNMADKYMKGRENYALGIFHSQAKLTEEAVRSIRAEAGITSQRKLAKRFGVSQSVISNITTHKTWKEVT